MNAVVDGLRRLEVSDKKADNNKATSLLDEIQDTGFTMFTKVTDLGCFGWRPAGKYRKLEHVDAKDILSHVTTKDVQPDALANLAEIQERLPIAFEKPPSQKNMNKYPYEIPHVVSLHVVAKYKRDSGVNVQDLDFIFGGSVMEVLGAQAIQKGSQYVVCQVPHTNAVIVKKHQVYQQDYSELGFQFERLVTGKGMSDRHDTQQIEHLQVIQVDKYQVLFSAELDAVDSSDGSYVEVKTSNPKYWGTKLMFQMISSGSTKLCSGAKGKGELTGVKLQPLRELAKRGLRNSDQALKLQATILAGMAAIRTQVKEHPPGQVYKLRFQDEELRLVPARGIDLLPSAEVVEELLVHV